MIWTILLSIAGFAIITFLLIYIMPFGIYAAYSYSGNKLTAAAFLLHLSICRVDYDVTDNSMRTRIFGFVLRGPKKDGGSSHDTSDKIKEAADSQSERNESDRPDEDSGSAPLNFEHGSFKDRENSSGFGNRAADSRSQSEKKTASDNNKKKSKENRDRENSGAASTLSGDNEEKKTGRGERLIDRVKKNPVVFFACAEPLRNKAVRWVFAFTKRTIKVIKIERCMINMSFAMDDPSISGKIYGYTEALRHALGLYSRRINIFFVPQFEKTQDILNCDLQISTSLFRLSRPAIIAVMTFPYYTFAVTWWHYRKMMRQGRDSNEKHN